MIELLKTVLLSDIDIPKWVSQKKESKVVLGKYYDATVTRLLAIREAFQKGIFCRRGGNLIPIESDGLYADRIGIGKVDLVIGSNYLHWPVNKLLSKIAGTASNSDALAQACFDALRPLSFLLRPKGIAVFMEGEDFVFFDDMPDEEKDFVGNVAVEHPVFLKFHTILNRILEEEYGIKRLMPVRSKLFPHSEIKTLFA
ncbi:hypothetical protein HYS99_00160 [Candidatus Giovannonibacteria bacterium]|nr:hypothetical protein [Candidatus Giovannonibacteria bacterium]